MKRKDIVFSDAYAKKKERRKDQKRCLQRMEEGFVCENSQLHLLSIDAVALYSEGKDHISRNIFIFRSLIYYKSSNSYRLKSNFMPLSCTRSRGIVLEALSKIGLNPKIFGLHSLKSGGATSAANAGVPDRLFKRHRRWRSEYVKDGYIKDDLKALLSVSLALGI